MGNDAKLGLVLGIALVLLIAVLFFRKEPAASVLAAPTSPQTPKKSPSVKPKTPTSHPSALPSTDPHSTTPGQSADELPKPRPVPTPPEEVPALPPPPVQ